MRTVSKLAITIASFASTGVALAGEPPTVAAAEDDAASPTTVTSEPAPAPAARYARDVISRVLTYPKGVLALGVDTSTLTSAFVDPASIRALVGYGITDELEWNFGAYAFPTSEVGKGSIDAGVGYAFVRGALDGKLELVARAQTGYNMATEAMNPMLVGVHGQYNITPKLAVITPGGQLTVGFDDPQPIAFGLPVSVGVQATPLLYLQLDTKLASISLKDSSNAFMFRDSTPVFVSATYNAIPALDLIAGIGVDLTPPASGEPAMEASVADTVSVLVGARYYVGKL